MRGGERWGVCRAGCAASFLSILFFTIGCGGGGGGGAQLAPPAADFSIAVTPSTMSVAPGATSAAVSVSVTAQNGFTGTVQATVIGLPAGVTANPSGTFSINAGQPVNVLFGADSSTGAG